MMQLHFNSVKLYNFGSYNDATFTLNDKGFCLVSGQNHFIKDNALSNGSGKSMCWSAICFALTGETINGIHSNLKNIFNEENLCYVAVDLNVDANQYVITRYIAPKSDLKILKNSVDISGKTLTDSKKILETELPDLTHELLASTILLGQGLPNKLSSFSPSGRKDLLEKLTKSDYMIADIKARLEARQSDLSKQDKDYSDGLLINRNTLTLAEGQLSKMKSEFDSAKKPDFDYIILKAKNQVTSLEAEYAATAEKINEYRSLADIRNGELLAVTEAKNKELTDLNESFNEAVKQQQLDQLQTDNDIKALEHEITHLRSIRDICPTCGQRLPNILKPDTSKQEEELKRLKTKSNELMESLADKKSKKTVYIQEINDKYAIKFDTINAEITKLRVNINQMTSKANLLNGTLITAKTELSNAEYNKLNWDKYYSNLKSQIDIKEAEIITLKNSISITESAKTDLGQHIAVLKKISTLVTRDFRGYLLNDIIKYLDQKSKEYCQIVFGTADLSIKLDKNNLDISYCDKQFDSLSGGEKQRCDIILQFAIRDLLQAYLGYTSNIIVLDEVFDNLDSKATEKILELISTKLKDIESVFIISHHSAELGLSYDTEIQITKNENGISEITKS